MRAAHWIRVGALRLLLLGMVACAAPADDTRLVPRSTLVVGVDVSASFDDGRWDDAMAFAAQYIYGHLEAKGELEAPRALFVGAIGGETPGQPQAFHPIHDFEGKTPAEIEADLRDWFEPNDAYTDFNAFFRRATSLVQRQNLVLAPITLVLLTDGVPDVGQTSAGADSPEPYAAINLEPLEYLARNVTVRVLYPDPTVAVHWERDVPRDRVRMWTVDHVVMDGWHEQLEVPDGRQIAAALPSEMEARLTPTQRGNRAPVPASPGPSADESAGEPVGEPATAEAPAEMMPAESAMVDTVGPAVGSAAEMDPAAGEYAAAAPPESAQSPELPESPESMELPESTEIGSSAPIPQPALWRWIKDNVDFRVGRRVF